MNDWRTACAVFHDSHDRARASHRRAAFLREVDLAQGKPYNSWFFGIGAFLKPGGAISF
ncbi:hypothetical protein [Caballeronia sp. INDeC2]|uniref:hypothetical protein n=1 Tax=Caballeronia sp. INDeC2 TaxID=2921747 RepID=UPI0020284ABD|nr:hypothetical protein [Caballeronia sp. INDeC2]